MSKNPVNRTVGGHIKEGLKNIPKVYKALYNAPTNMNKGAPGKGLVTTVKDNVKFIAKGPSKARAMSPQQKTQANNMRGNLVGMGVASVTPAGPIAAFALGVKKSIQDKKQAKAQVNAPKVGTKPTVALKLKDKTKK
jgi:hypothetical protein